METVKFKKAGQKIVFQGKGLAVKEITEATITVDIARALILKNSNFERLFVFGDTEANVKLEVKSKSVKESKSVE